MRAMMDQVRVAHGARIWPEIDNPSAEQRAAMLFEVECRGLTVHDLGEASRCSAVSREVVLRRQAVRATLFSPHALLP
jgi:hypothetical protein